MPASQDRNDDAAKAALSTAVSNLMVFLAATFLASCAKVEAVEQNENAPILVDEPISISAPDPVIVSNDAAPTTVTNVGTNQVEASELPR